MQNKEYLSKILPHKDSMILIDDVVEYSIEEKYLISKVTISTDSLFYNKEIKGIDSTVGIEYMAQTIGCYAYYKNNKKEPEIGFLLGTRLFNNSIEKFELQKTYTIHVKEIYVDEISSFECIIYNDKKEEIMSATLNVYLEAKTNE